MPCNETPKGLFKFIIEQDGGWMTVRRAVGDRAMRMRCCKMIPLEITLEFSVLLVINRKFCYCYHFICFRILTPVTLCLVSNMFHDDN
jgi:hypothetical protein